MKMYSLVVVLSLLFLSNAFNLEHRIPIIKKGAADSYFGFSVAEHQSIDDVTAKVRQNWLLVGAPLDNNLQPKTNRSGALWKCPITTYFNDCEQVVTDGKRNGVGQYGSTVDSNHLMPPLPDEIKDGQWMGVTVRSQKPGGKVLVCAHRYIRQGPDFQWGHGLCYTLTQDLDYDDTWEPCKGRSVKKAHEEYGYCQAGTSGYLLDDDTAVIGTPGLYTWRGTVFVFSVSDAYLQRDKTTYYGPHTEFDSPVDKYSYLGMSSTGGHFFSKTDVSYAAGAPRANSTGQVVIFGKNKRNNPMQVRLVISGEQFASSFGYELASADLNGDGLPELIVGAPFYYSRDAGGAVYIYYNKNYCLDCAPPQKLTGLPESRFGFAITNLKDLNKDGFEDLAIGAPYEDSGVVYIYLGSEQGLISEPSQIIRASSVPTHPVTFGYSLSGGVDLDGNDYPDLLVGAYESDKVVFLRSRPIIDITTEVVPESALRNIDPTQIGCERDQTSEYTCFSFKTCCAVALDSENQLMAHYHLEAETFQQKRKFSRVWFGKNETRPSVSSGVIVLSRSQSKKPLQNCQDHTVYLKENTVDIQSPIKLKLRYTLVQRDPTMPRPGDSNPNLLPILNQREAYKILEATFQKECGTDDVCQSDLRTLIDINLPPGDGDADFAFMLGSVNALPINVSIANHGESAYESQFFVVHPASVNYNKIDSESKQVACQSYNKTVVACQIGNPFKNGSEIKFQVKFDVDSNVDNQGMLDFVTFTNTTSRDENPSEQYKIRIAVLKKAEVSIAGHARPEQVFYGGAVRGESAIMYRDDIGTKVVHTYSAYNAGPTRVQNLEIVISWPFQIANNKPQGKWLLYLDEVPTVEAHGGGQCYIPADYINPLHLEARRAMFDIPSTDTPNAVDNSTEEIANSLRRKREVRVRSQRITDEDGRTHTVVNMNCVNGTAKCLKFKCLVFNIHANQEAIIRISSRLWNSSLVEDYSRVSYVSIASRAELAMAGQSLIQNRDDDVADAITRAYPELASADSEVVAPWILVVASVCGLLFLLFIILVLWKLGFFVRNRPDPTLSGNLQKANSNLE